MTETEMQLPPAHLMRIEIFEQPATLARLVERAEIVLQPVAAAGRRCAFAMLAARGSSDNASTYGKYLIEGLARTPTAQASPSLYTLYGTPPRLNNALVVGVSQSGAAADVIAVLEEGRRQSAVTLAITNTAGSPMTKAAEHVLLLEAGLERALAATKTVTGQCAAYALLAADLAGDAALKQDLRNLPDVVQQVLTLELELQRAAKLWLDAEQVVVIGRGYTYGAAGEIALKLKETCFIGAQAYSAADFLHGPLAMIEPGYPVVVLLNHDATLETTVQFMERVLQRGGNILCLATHQATARLQLTDARLIVLDMGEMPSLLSNIAFIVAGQLFAMHLSVMRGHNPDVSRGVTKVTVTK
jgi:glucosamine--fructose-6-phosphate aminotransferase (isomerizing)